MALPDLPDGFKVYIKRDDLTGTLLTGNKIRKLEFLLAEALDQGCTDIITTGDMQSNHCRATVVAARLLGMQTHLVIKTPVQEVSQVPFTGNMYINRMCGAHMHLCDSKEPRGDVIKQKMDQVARSIKEKTGKDVYVVPRGASCLQSIYAYMDTYDEMMQQGLLDHVTDIVLSSGGAGTIAGIAIANHLVASDNIRVHGIRVAYYDKRYSYDFTQKCLDGLGINVKAEDIFCFYDKNFEGYGISSQDQLAFMSQVSQSTGIILDDTYTGKAAYAMFNEIKSNPTIFKGKNILYIHTGGLPGAAEEKMKDLLQQSGEFANSIHIPQ